MHFTWKSIWWIPLFVAVILAFAILIPMPVTETTDTLAGPVLIIDAGHGGADGGAVAGDGTLESGINLDIALRLEALAGFWGVDTVMTRRSEEIDYPSDALSLSAMKRADQYARVALINSTPGAVLLSIHQNKYPASSPYGPQVFYGTIDGGEDFASIVQQNLTGYLCPTNRRLATTIDEKIFLMKKVACPAILVECGFLSNPDELAKLKTPEYRMELAAIFLASYLEYIGDTQV